MIDIYNTISLGPKPLLRLVPLHINAGGGSGGGQSQLVTLNSLSLIFSSQYINSVFQVHGYTKPRTLAAPRAAAFKRRRRPDSATKFT